MIQLYRTSSRVVSSLVLSSSSCCSSCHHRAPPPLLKFPPSSSLSRQFSSDSSDESLKRKSCKFEAVSLKSRSLIKLRGPDTLPFLQGLITNDVSHFESRPSIYALFLNTQGRVLWDTLLYHVVREGGGDEESETFIECDSSVKSNLIKHLKTFRLRKKVDVVDAGEGDSGVDLWVVFDHGHTTLAKELLKDECCGPVLQQTSKRADFPVSIDPSLLSFGDPRLNELGWRLFVPKRISGSFPPKDITISGEESYVKLRYALGVAEGVKELPSGGCFPLESNGDYLHGVSFHKGCYIGQELTARSHHTGVIRKRIMPFRLPEGHNLENIDPGTLQLVAGNKSLGKIRGISGSLGIGLIRIEGALAASSELKIQDVPVNIEKPFWWPREASKEKLNRQ